MGHVQMTNKHGARGTHKVNTKGIHILQEDTVFIFPPEKYQLSSDVICS